VDLSTEQSKDVAELCAMAPGVPKKAFSAWDAYHDRIVQAFRTMYPDMSHENEAILLKEIQRRFPANFVGNTEAVLDQITRVAKPFIEFQRQQLWEANKACALPMIRETIPPAAREFGIYYTTQLLNHVFHRFRPEIWPVDVIPEKLKGLVDEVVPPAVAQLTTGDGELRDEELVRLYKAGYEKCGTMLLERYATKLHDLAPRIIYAKNLCPSMKYPSQFAKDVAQEVALKLMQKLGSYKFDSKFETWVGSIIENEAKTLGARKQFGRAKAGPRTHISFEDLEQELASPVIPIIENREHQKILRKTLQKHRAGGIKDANSADAIELRYFEELETPEIAKRIGATESYVARLFSDDYPKVRRILIDDFGLTGTAL
jgi:RNA polymerase sigma factor (sigma-70 family)